MALHILKGEPQLFFWGQPYMGALEAYLSSFLFFLFGSSAFVLHMTDVCIMAFMLFLVNRIGTLIGGWVVGFLAAIYWALAPLYLSIVGQLATGGHVEACAAGAFRPIRYLPAGLYTLKKPGCPGLPDRSDGRAGMVVQPVNRPFFTGRGHRFIFGPASPAP